MELRPTMQCLDKIMNKRIEYALLIKQITSCENLQNLQDVIPFVNDFIRKYQLRSDSQEYKKLETVISLMKIKLKHNFNTLKNLDEDSLSRIIRNILKEEIKNKNKTPK